MALKRIAPFFLLLFLLSSSVSAQDQSESATSEVFMNGNIGFGIPYGGLGLNFELGAGHVSSFAGFGFAPKRTIDTIVLQPTLNYLLGFRYYFDAGFEYLYPRVGLSFGWVTNYYNSRIGNAAYRQKVDGLSLHVGAQVYSAGGFVFNVDLCMSSKYTIINQDSHPYFFTFYARPAIGIGYDINSIGQRKKRSKTIKNDKINPLE